MSVVKWISVSGLAGGELAGEEVLCIGGPGELLAQQAGEEQ
jgi:hypothetical protein